MARTYHRPLKSTSALLLLLAAIGSSGCASLSFYASAAAGQLGILTSRRPVDEVIADPDTDDATRRQLATARSILEFAESNLGLEVGGRYRSYVALDRRQLIWNLFVAPELDTRGVQWCYPIVGCAVYRGYFSERRARAAARRYDLEGFDTFVGGVAAYSTLGWFDDPLSSTFIGWRDEALAALLFHELAHSVVYVRGDTAFNEAFAMFVGRQGVVEWLRARGEDPDGYLESERVRTAFFDFLMSWRDRLQRIYDSKAPDDALRLIKSDVLEAMTRDYDARKMQLGGGLYDAYMSEPFNNARLLTVGAYHDRVGAFEALFVDQGGSWNAFYAAVKALGRLDPEARHQALDALSRRLREGTYVRNR